MTLNKIEDNQLEKETHLPKTALKRTAYHEAGHGVIGCRFGYRYCNMSIIPEPSKHRYGVCCFYSGIKKSNPEQEILMLLAGHAAQKAYDPDDKREPSITDYRKVWHLSKSMRPGTYSKLISKTNKLVADNLMQIQAVAEALLEFETLEGDLCAIIIECVDNGINWRQHKELKYWDLWKKLTMNDTGKA